MTSPGPGTIALWAMGLVILIIVLIATAVY
jgi:hypothetical protein